MNALCRRFARECDSHRNQLASVVERYGEDREEEPERLHAPGPDGTRTGGVGLLRDRELMDVVTWCEKETSAQLAWLTTRIKEAAPQALVMS